MYQRNYYRSKKLKSGKRIFPKIILSIFALIIILFFIYSMDLFFHRGKIYSNVIAISQEIGKMNRIQANQALSPVVERMVSKPLVISHNGLEMSLIPKEDLGASVNIEQLINEAYSVTRRGTLWNRLKERMVLLRQNYYLSGFLVLNKDKFDMFYTQLQSKIEQNPRDAELKSNRIIPSQLGIKIDRLKLLEQIQEKIIDSVHMETSSIIMLPVHYEEPTILTSELLAQIGVYETISTFETSLQGKEENTRYNIQKSSEQINGILLRPGESFSFNQLVGPAEKEDGYKESTIIVNGQFVNGYGGGVCQVSTTLYNAVLLANLQVIERYHHSIYGDATDYVPLGRDAAIFFGYKDLKFRNSLAQQIVIFSEIKGDKLVASIYGEKALDKRIKIITQDKRVHDFEIIKIRQEHNRDLENKILQEGIPGYSIKTYRVVIDAGKENIEFISHDNYISVPMKELVE